MSSIKSPAGKSPAGKSPSGKSSPDHAADAALRQSLIETLGLPERRVAAFEDDTALFGALPELDSMAVATLLTDLEDRLGIVIDDDDLDAETFETFGSLHDFLAHKLSVRRH